MQAFHFYFPRFSVDEKAVPVSRCKHGAVLQGEHVYLLGGRNGNLALKDFWRYHIGNTNFNLKTESKENKSGNILGDNVWEQIKAGGETPGCLQVDLSTVSRTSLRNLPALDPALLQEFC